ncbi:IS66 family insertion sequence element accessory protein TnpB [Desulfogranum marinum]|uniref:IS66 family insertion sequence element accessory protein TnpB n=1 Tax=Desulfogranum marinum TaxID=453220 RepID=UPI0019651A41|nr:IS66 family insertion sequence element accessory protein TnpB [Desulfogranum marinum]
MLPCNFLLIATGATSLRKSIDTLSILVAKQLELEPLSGYLFCFCNRKGIGQRLVAYRCLIRELRFNEIISGVSEARNS